MADNQYDFDEVLIEHADRCWKAECENAERLSKERHLLITVLVAFLGVGIFKIEWVQGLISKTSFPSLQITITSISTVLLVWALVNFFLALRFLAHKPAHISASAWLSLPERVYYPAGGMTANEQRRQAFARTYRAYQVLQQRNADGRKRLSDAWHRFFCGMVLVASVVVIYIACRLVSIST